MAIDKKNKKLIQITMPKADVEQLDTLVSAFNKEGIPMTRSRVLVKALQEYIKILVAVASTETKSTDKVEEPQGDKKDA